MRTTAFVVLVSISSASGQATANQVLPSGAKVFIAPVPDGFDEFLKAAIEKKQGPLQIVAE